MVKDGLSDNDQRPAVADHLAQLLASSGRPKIWPTRAAHR